MDIPKPGIGSQSPISQPGGGGSPAPAGGGDSGSKFADVLGGGQGPAGAKGPQNSPFASPILDPDLPGGQKAGGVQHKRKVGGTDTDMRAGRTQHPLQQVGELAGKPASGVDPGISFQKVADSAIKAENKIDAMINAAQKGKTFSANELIALQVEVFRYSQTVEVISRTTDKVVGAVKQTLGTQV